MSRSIERVYIGLPEHLANNVLWVERKSRTNRLSHLPGGCDIVIEYSDGKVFGYDWIKSAYAYISRLPIGSDNRDNDPLPIESDKGVDNPSPIGSAEIVNLYARKYNEHNFNKVPFEQVWNTGDGDYDSMLAALKKFDGNYTYNGGLLDKDLSAMLDILLS